MPRSSGKEQLLLAKYEGRFADPATGTPLSFAEGAELFAGFRKLVRRLGRIARISDNYQNEIKRLVLELQDALAKVKELKGCLPICASCKKIRNDDGYWKQLEHYLAEHSDALFSHGLCPECAANYLALSRHAPEQPAPTTVNPAHLLDETDLDDPVIVRFLPLLNDRNLVTAPLFGDFSALFQRYVRLTKRLKRIARISDSYQSQLRDLKTQLEHASHTDYLTGLANRRAMYDILAAEYNRASRHGGTFAVVMLDFDKFKEINDSYGHDVGDRILVAAAGAVRAQLRKEDSFARWGGEEFMALFPETDRQAAFQAAEKLRELIAGVTVEADGATIRPTASLGVAVFRPGEALADCIKRADEALRLAKHSGRNRTVLPGTP